MVNRRLRCLFVHMVGRTVAVPQQTRYRPALGVCSGSLDTDVVASTPNGGLGASPALSMLFSIHETVDERSANGSKFDPRTT
jgi:hypothetical protein